MTLQKGQAVAANYELVCDDAWRTRTAKIEVTSNCKPRVLALAVENGLWSMDNRELPDLRSCIDIDLGWSPATNMLPIRRLNLPLGGDSGIINAAWVKFPELSLEILPQRYQRLAHDRYRYSSRQGDFVADIHVDAAGIPIEYEGFWRRI